MDIEDSYYEIVIDMEVDNYIINTDFNMDD